MAPVLPQVACFDTAFHRTQPTVAQAFALPRRYFEEGVRRYGFHGLSYEYIASVLPTMDRRAGDGRTVVAHLGNGASMCAMSDGRSIATTMSFTALDGLMMGTRCGAIDPGVLLYLIEHHGMDAATLCSGFFTSSPDCSASQVFPATCASFCRVPIPRRRGLGVCSSTALSASSARSPAALGGLDALVFTGGIGENAVSIRARVCRDASWLGLELDEEANANGGPCISREGSRVSAWVIPTNEELMIAMHTRRLLGSRI